MRYLIIELFEKMYHGKLQSLVWDAMLVDTNIATNMAAGNRQKHLETGADCHVISPKSQGSYLGLNLKTLLEPHYYSFVCV